ncbi:MAG TPA: M23 family metallopeptidase [Terriglobia bacterium]|nr:M23 family metallopeptidase [Terriglobia bacterium]
MPSNRKYYTFLIVAPHGRLRKIQLPHYAVHLALVIGFGALIGLAALANSYARMLLKVANYNDVRNEREALKTQYQNLESTASSTNAKLTSLESLASEVALTYGFGTNSRPALPRALFALATQSNATLEASYNASSYAFNLMKTTALSAPPDPMIRALVPSITTFDRAAIPTLWPLHGQITGGFGERMDPLSGEEAVHAGVDISAPKGTDVEATGDGVVLEAGRHESGYGNEVIIDHGDGISTKYAHLSAVYVTAGEEVTRGEVIGAVGMTGRSTGPHLHYEVLVHNTPVNPAKFLGK